MKRKYYIIGIDDSDSPSLSFRAKEIISEKSLFCSGLRHYKIVKNILPAEHRWIEIKPPMDNLFNLLSMEPEVVVIASGDPLFCGFATTVMRYLPDAEIEVIPWFNSLQQLAHRALMPYDDMVIAPLTGRDWVNLDCALIEGREKIGVLTDRIKTPAAIARRMLEWGYDNYLFTIGQHLGNPLKEIVSVCSIREVASGDFPYPNNIILSRLYKKPSHFGIDEADIESLEGRPNMITKRGVRLLSLSLLKLKEMEVMWDIGFCTGSISIEAKLLKPTLTIHSFEKRDGSAELLKRNARKFGAIGINIHECNFKDLDIKTIERTDAIFIGGYGGDMRSIFSICADRIKIGGRVVFNSVSEKSKLEFSNLCTEFGFMIEQTTRIAIDHHNPIEVIGATLLKR